MEYVDPTPYICRNGTIRASDVPAAKELLLSLTFGVGNDYLVMGTPAGCDAKNEDIMGWMIHRSWGEEGYKKRTVPLGTTHRVHYRCFSAPTSAYHIFSTPMPEPKPKPEPCVSAETPDSKESPKESAPRTSIFGRLRETCRGIVGLETSGAGCYRKISESSPSEPPPPPPSPEVISRGLVLIFRETPENPGVWINITDDCFPWCLAEIPGVGRKVVQNRYSDAGGPVPGSSFAFGGYGQDLRFNPKILGGVWWMPSYLDPDGELTVEPNPVGDQVLLWTHELGLPRRYAVKLPRLVRATWLGTMNHSYNGYYIPEISDMPCIRGVGKKGFSFTWPSLMFQTSFSGFKRKSADRLPKLPPTGVPVRETDHQGSGDANDFDYGDVSEDEGDDL